MLPIRSNMVMCWVQQQRRQRLEEDQGDNRLNALLSRVERKTREVSRLLLTLHTNVDDGSFLLP